jgi:hypothetical protein
MHIYFSDKTDKRSMGAIEQWVIIAAFGRQ